LENRINYQIRETEVRLVGAPEGYTDGVYPTKEAYDIAKGLELDLIEINSKSKPVICKIMDYSKFKYQLKQKEKDQKKNQKGGEQKELKFTPDISDHDLETKAKKAVEFLKDKNKVRCVVEFRGRNINYKEKGELVLYKLSAFVEDFGVPETLAKMEGKKMMLILKPKK
jgi:translation initiation factor IF-3